MKTIAKALIVFGFLFLFLIAASSLWAADPAGDSPVNGLTPTCAFQPLGAGASVWLKIPYRFDYRLQFTLDGFGLSGLKFDVYSSATATSPIGTGNFNPNEPTHDLNWEGRLQENGFFYVLVKNSNSFPASYRFCVNEKLPFYPPAPPAPVCCPCQQYTALADQQLLPIRCCPCGLPPVDFKQESCP